MGFTGAFWYFALVNALSSLCGLYFCQLISVSVASPQIAVSIFPAALFLIIAFAGFVVRIPTLPAWLRDWAPEFSFARWAFQGLMINEFEGNTENFPARQITMILQEFGFDGFDKWNSIPILLLSIGVMFLLTYLPIRFISHERR
jgi:hypothetical protein